MASVVRVFYSIIVYYGWMRSTPTYCEARAIASKLGMARIMQ